MTHLPDNPLLPRMNIRRRQSRLEAERIRQRRREQRGLGTTQFAGRNPEIAPAGRLDPEQMVTEFGNVQINGQDALLAPEHFQKKRKPDLEAFADKTFGWTQKQILRDLLRYRARSTETTPIEIVIDRRLNRMKIEPPMFEKTLILGRDHRLVGGGRDIFSAYPMVVDRFERRLVTKILDMPVQHESGRRQRQPTEQHTKPH